MRLLHVSDFHANRHWFNWTLDHANDFDLIAYTGDFLLTPFLISTESSQGLADTGL